MSERCERMSERRSEWRVDFIVILPIVRWSASMFSYLMCDLRQLLEMLGHGKEENTAVASKWLLPWHETMEEMYIDARYNSHRTMHLYNF